MLLNATNCDKLDSNRGKSSKSIDIEFLFEPGHTSINLAIKIGKKYPKPQEIKHTILLIQNPSFKKLPKLPIVSLQINSIFKKH